MPKPKLNDLAVFQEWLIESYSISQKSASVYASRVRKTLNSIEEVTQQQLNDFVETIANSSSLDTFLSSWNRFVLFLRNERQISIPKMKRPSKERRNTKVKIDQSVLELAYYFKHSMSISYTKMLGFTWSSVAFQKGDYWEISDPKEFGIYYKVPTKLLQDIAFVAFGDYPINLMHPFLKALHQLVN